MIAVVGTGHALPATIRRTEDLAPEVGVEPEWALRRTGIEIRHAVTAGEDTLGLAVRAARAALERAAVPPEALDLVLVATVTPDVPTPALAPRVAHALGASCGAFDVGAACAGFVHALAVARGQAAIGAERILLVGADVLTPWVDPEDRDTAFLFGDGAGAVVLGPSRGAPGLVATRLGSDGGRAAALGIVDGRIRMDGRAVFRAAATHSADAVRAVCRDAGWTCADLDWLVPHQANARVIATVARRLEIPCERVLREIADVGNTSAASIPIALDRGARDGRLQAGQRVVLTAIGAGLVWGAAALWWR